MKERVLRILMNIRDDIDYENSTSIMEDRLLSSLDLMQLISELDEQFQTVIPATEIKANNFNSLDAIIALMEKLTGKADL